MSDELDRTIENEQVMLDQHIQLTRSSVADRLPITSLCHYCAAPVGEKKFCDEDCSQDWHAERAAALRNHGAYRSASE